MGKFLPFAGKNSIAEMSIGIQLSAPFDQRIGEAADAIKVDFAAEFPKFDPLQMQMFTVNFGSTPFPMPGGSAPTVGGFTLTKNRTDGSISRLFRVVSNVLSVHFMDYTSWKETKPQALDYLSRCLERLAVLGRNPATAILLRYIDRFTFDGASNEATAALLFRPDTKFVAARILNTGSQWHSNSGWFEPFADAALVLNQLNVSSSLTQATVSVVVDHNSVYISPRAYSSLDDLIRGAGEQLALEAVLEQQHSTNAHILKNLLNDDMLQTVGLKG
jgi:uncharacterized protein (TIGR04255 family)